jgi:hypothetical protein
MDRRPKKIIRRELAIQRLEELRESIMADIERLREMKVASPQARNSVGRAPKARRRAVGEASRGCLRLGGWPSARTAPRSLTLLGTVPGLRHVEIVQE